MTSNPAHLRGFTLIELMVSIVAASIVVLAALALVSAQQRLFRSSSEDRRLQEAGRIALDEITANLRMAGYGIDPAVAFDFGTQASFTMDRAPTTVSSVSAASYLCNTSVSCRDKADGPDEIVFHYRNPSFVRSIAVQPTGASPTTLIIAGPLNAPLYKGQILQVMCFGGDQLWAYVTVGQNVPASTAAAPQISIPLESGTADRFPFQNSYLANPCFAAIAPRGAAPVVFAAAAKVYKVDRFRYFIGCYDPDGTLRANAANCNTGARPYLMLDQGLKDSSNGNKEIFSVIAPDVEDLQLSYVFPNSANPLYRLVGATGSAITSGPFGIDLAPGAGAPLNADASDAASRASQHPANIRAVNVSIVVRSSEPDIAGPNTSDSLPDVANRSGTVGPADYTRQVFQTSAAVRNTDSRASYFPVYTTTVGDGYNVGGG